MYWEQAYWTQICKDCKGQSEIKTKNPANIYSNTAPASRLTREGITFFQEDLWIIAEKQNLSQYPVESRYSYFRLSVILEVRITSYDYWFLIKHSNIQPKHFSKQSMLYIIRLSQLGKAGGGNNRKDKSQKTWLQVWRAWDYSTYLNKGLTVCFKCKSCWKDNMKWSLHQRSNDWPKL